MKRLLSNRGSFCIYILLLLSLGSCRTAKYGTDADIHAIVRASNKLGFDIERKDNHYLMIEAAQWLGVPYRYGGTNHSGIDCSGLSQKIYRNVFGIQLERNSKAQLYENVKKKVRKSKLQQGDLVFFSPNGSKKKVNHVGIFLKNNKFIHSSTSKGVRIDDLDDKYWEKQWATGGRVIE